jgi:hypothetical protein
VIETEVKEQFVTVSEVVALADEKFRHMAPPRTFAAAIDRHSQSAKQWCPGVEDRESLSIMGLPVTQSLHVVASSHNKQFARQSSHMSPERK